MATMIQSVGSLTWFPNTSGGAGTDNLASLPDAAAKPLGEIDNSTNDYPSAKVQLILNLASSGLDVTGIVDVYLLSCLDTSGTATNWTDGIDGDSTSDESGNIRNARLIKTFKADASMAGLDIMWVCNDLSLLTDQDGVMVGDLPPHWSLLIHNQSGAAFQATGNTAKYQAVTYGT